MNISLSLILIVALYHVVAGNRVSM